MIRPDLDAIRAKWKQRNVVSGNDVPTLLRHIDTLEHMLAEERENVDTLRREIDKAQAAFDYGCGQDGPDGWKPGETAIDALVRAKHERDELRTTVEELKARIVVLEAMKP